MTRMTRINLFPVLLYPCYPCYPWLTYLAFHLEFAMSRRALLLLLAVLLLSMLPLGPLRLTPVWASEDAEKTASAWVEANAGRIARLSDSLWDYAELAFQEHRSSKLLADTLESAGFT